MSLQQRPHHFPLGLGVLLGLSVPLVQFGLLVLLGFLANRLFTGTSHDYMLASHSIGPFLLLMSLFGTTMTAFALVGSTGRAYTLGAGVYGLLASAGGIVHSLCFFLIGLRLWAIGRKNGYRTQIQFFRERLDNHFIGYLLFPILVVLVVSYLLLGVVAAGAVINGITAGTFEPYGWFEAADHTFRFDFLATEHGNEEEELIAQVVLGVDPAAARSKL